MRPTSRPDRPSIVPPGDPGAKMPEFPPGGHPSNKVGARFNLPPSVAHGSSAFPSSSSFVPRLCYGTVQDLMGERLIPRPQVTRPQGSTEGEAHLAPGSVRGVARERLTAPGSSTTTGRQGLKPRTADEKLISEASRLVGGNPPTPGVALNRQLGSSTATERNLVPTTDAGSIPDPARGYLYTAPEAGTKWTTSRE